MAVRQYRDQPYHAMVEMTSVSLFLESRDDQNSQQGLWYPRYNGAYSMIIPPLKGQERPRLPTDQKLKMEAYPFSF